MKRLLRALAPENGWSEEKWRWTKPEEVSEKREIVEHACLAEVQGF